MRIKSIKKQSEATRSEDDFAAFKEEPPKQSSNWCTTRTLSWFCILGFFIANNIIFTGDEQTGKDANGGPEGGQEVKAGVVMASSSKEWGDEGYEYF